MDLSDVEPEIQGTQWDLIAFDERVERLAARDPRAAALVKLRFFAGLTIPRLRRPSEYASQPPKTTGLTPSLG